MNAQAIRGDIGASHRPGPREMGLVYEQTPDNPTGRKGTGINGYRRTRRSVTPKLGSYLA